MRFVISTEVTVILLVAAAVLLVFVVVLLIHNNRKDRKTETYRHEAPSSRYYGNEYFGQTRTRFRHVDADNAGSYGEYLIYTELKSLENEGARFLFNALIPKRGGGRSEIDVIALTKGGIFIIESKNYSGKVYGYLEDQQWIQERRNGEEIEFYNPVWQNDTHCLNLISYLNLDDSKFMSYIVFSDKCEFVQTPKNGEDYRIVHLGELYVHISRDIKKRGNILSAEAIEKIYQKLLPLTQESEAVRQQHINEVRYRA